MAQRMALAGEINGEYFDRYSIGHAAFGVLMAFARIPPIWALVIAVGFESSEDWLKDAFPDVFPLKTHDTPKGYVGDLVSTMAGYTAIKLLPPPPPLRGPQ